MRVTEIIGPYVDFSMIPESVLQYASERGTEVHGACASIALNLFPGFLDDEIKPYTKSFEKWFDTQVEEVLEVEKRFYHSELGYNGQIDLYVKLKTGEYAIIDLKTPVTTNKAWAVQLAGYKMLAENNGLQVDKTGSLQLSPDGKAPKMKWYENDLQDNAIFMSALNCFRYFKK